MHGGKRAGAGRKAGVTSRPHISSYWTPKQIKEFFETLFERAKTDSKIAVWVGDQLSGKAQQSIDHTTLGREFPTPLYVPRDDSAKEDSAAQ